MNVKIGNLIITSFCNKNIEHLKFIRDLKEDDLIYQFVSTDVEEELKTTSEKLELEKSYIIETKKEPIGYISIKKIINEDKIIELRYAVHPEHRRFKGSINKGYGQQILEECSTYIFDNMNIDSIDLHIRKDNEASIGCAKKANYKCIDENDDEYYYIYRLSK